ncbi:MAG: hypothetical protein JJU12_07510 [Chlamydiales bacterium]|nr:hypothetical protein [Chlamydiales bacterium]
MEPFYGQEIDPELQKREIKKILSKYNREPVSEELKKQIYHDLVVAKEQGKILIPFKVVMRKSPDASRRDFIEVILDTKV